MFHEMKRGTLHPLERQNVPRNTVTAYMQAELTATELAGYNLISFGPVFTCRMMARLNAWISSGERDGAPIVVFAYSVSVH